MGLANSWNFGIREIYVRSGQRVYDFSTFLAIASLFPIATSTTQNAVIADEATALALNRYLLRVGLAGAESQFFWLVSAVACYGTVAPLSRSAGFAR